jgi:adenylate cyclase
MNGLRKLLSRRRYEALALAVALLLGALHVYVDTEAVAEARGSGSGTKALAELIHFLEGRATDLQFQLRGATRPHPDVVVAVVDEKSVLKYGVWPWSRSLVARALLNLHRAEVGSVGMDMAFTEEVHPQGPTAQDLLQRLDEATRQSPEAQVALAGYRQHIARLQAEDPDQVLEEAVAACPEVVMGLIAYQDSPDAEKLAPLEAGYAAALKPHALWRFPSENGVSVFEPGFEQNLGWRVRSLQTPIERFARRARRMGHFNAFPDPDGVIRRLALFAQVQSVQGLIPALSLQTAAVQMGATLEPAYNNLTGKLDGARLRVEGRPPVLVPMLRSEPYALIDHVGPPGAFHSVSLADVVDGTFDPADLKGKAVVMGVSLIGYGMDQRVTPFSEAYPGTYIHASMVSNILAGQFLRRPVELRMVELLVMLGMAFLLARALPRVRFQWKLALVAGLLATYFAVDQLLFVGPKLLLATVMPLSSIFLTSFGVIFLGYLSTDREKLALRHAFQHYLNASVMEQMLQNPDRLKLGGEKKEMTVLFSDIRGFTTLSERMAPEALVNFMNGYLTPMTRIVFEEGGTLDKYIGDALMAFWGAPVDQPDHAVRACRASVRFLEKLKELKALWRDQHLPEFDIGVGINSGPMIVGNMGSDIRFDYTVMGDSVNLASRLEGTNKEYETRILISEDTYALAKDHVVARRLGAVRVKGKRKPVRIYELRGLGQAQGADLEAISAFEAAVDAFAERRWDEAERGFRRVLELWADDPPSRRYLEEIQQFRTQPPPEQWDGVYTATTK